MKIQVVTNLYPSPWEPNRASFNRQQFANLAAGNAVRIIVLVPWLTALKHLRELGTAERDGLQVSFLPYFHIPGTARRLHPFFIFLSLLCVSGAIRRWQPDCLLLSWAYPDAVAGSWLGRFLGIPRVIKIHGSDLNMHGQYPPRARQLRRALLQAQGVLAVSRALKEKTTALGVQDERVRVVYNGVDAALFYPGAQDEARDRLDLPRGRRLLLYIGNLKASKGCMDLLDTFARVASEDATLDLYYVGSGQQRDPILRRARDMGLENRVFLPGGQPHAVLRDWINASNLVCLLSHNEGVPNVLLEAMSCGVPVLATRVGGIPEVVPDAAGVLVDRGGDYAGALRVALQRKWQPEQILAGVAGFTWENNTRQLLELLRLAAQAPEQRKG